MTDKMPLMARYAKVAQSVATVARKTQGYGYKYADLQEIIKTLQPHCVEQNIAVVQQIHMQDYETTSPALILRVLDTSSSESIMISEMQLPIEGIKPQDVGKLITYYRRYQLLAAFGLASEDDDAASFDKSPQRNPQPKNNDTPASQQHAIPSQPGCIKPDQADQIWQLALKKGLSKEELLEFCTLKAKRTIARLGQIKIGDEFQQIINALQQ